MVRVHSRPQETLDRDIERFFASIRLNNREKLDQLEFNLVSFDLNMGK